MQYTHSELIAFETKLKNYILETGLKGNVGYATGFEEVDSLVGKCLPGDLIIITGRPSMGKTSLLLSLSTMMCENYQAKTVIYSIESSKEALCTRLLCAKSGFSKETMHKDGELVPEATKAMAWLLGLLEEGLLEIFDEVPSSSEEFLKKYESFLTSGVKIIFTDHLGEIPLDPKFTLRTHALGALTRKIKHLSRQYEAVSFVLHQLNRDVEKRPDKRPQLSDLRDSGEIEQIADKIWGLYRGSYYSKAVRKDETELLALKSKDSATGTAMLSFNAETTSFEKAKRIKKPRRNIKITIEPL